MKFYNRYISTIMLVAAVATLPACNKKLDVVPGKEIVPEQILTASDVQAVLMGAYSNLQDPNAFGERMVLVLFVITRSMKASGRMLPVISRKTCGNVVLLQ
jgi:hypothetical protein